MTRRRSTPLSRLLLALVLALALFGRWVLPAGWMAEARDGEVQVLLCSAQGPAPMTIDLGGDAPRETDPASPCPFALAAGPLLDEPPAALAIARAAPRLHLALASTSPRSAAHRHARPPATGPPALA